jgi:hypothetical protein
MVGNGCISDSVNNLCFIHLGPPYLHNKRSTNRTTATTLMRHREGRGQTRKEQVTPASPRPRSPEARGHPLDRRSGLHFAWTHVAPTQILALESASRQQPT